MTGFDSKRQAAMDKLVEIQEELGMYDDQKPPMTKDEALKQMLNEIDAGLKTALTRINELVAENKALKEALEQPEQEPVATMKMLHTYGDTALKEKNHE